MLEERVARCRKVLQEQVSAAVVLSPENRFYLTGMRTSAGMVVLTGEDGWFFTDFRYIEAARKKVTHLRVELIEGGYPAAAQRILEMAGVQSCGIEDASMSVAEYRRFEQALGMELVGVSQIFSTLRSVKEKEEIRAIKKAQAITDKAFLHILDFLRPGRTEREVALELDYFMRKNGAEGSAFQTIAVAGENSSLPHGVPGDRPLRSGDFITMDFGAMADGYCSDMTRTVAIGGVSDLMRLVYETVLEAQSRAFARICAGVKGSDVDRVARDYIAEAGFDGCFGHGLGHSLGIEIHEPPAFSRACAEPIPEGSVLSVEPGIYLEGRFGVRIEDIVLVTEHGFENLTHSPKELFVR